MRTLWAVAATVVAVLAGSVAAPPALATHGEGELYLTSLAPQEALLEVPNSMTVVATANRSVYGTGTWIAIVNETTGEVRDCYDRDVCGMRISTNWAMNANPQPIRVRSELRGAHSAGGQSAVIDVQQFFFDVSLSFSSYTDYWGSLVWSVRARAQPSTAGSPYELAIKNAAGTTVRSCAATDGCGAVATPGETYYAVVEDPTTGQQFGSSSHWTLDAEKGPTEAVADDVDLAALATMFASTSAVCEWFILHPGHGTNAAGSSVSDQGLACQAAERAGKGKLAALLAAAGVGGASLWVWDMLDEKTREQGGQQPPPPPVVCPPEDPTCVPPPPPVPSQREWPSGLETAVGRLRVQNPALDSDLKARRVLKRCQRYIVRLGYGGYDKCLELPVFVSGDLDVPEPTQHDREAIERNPQWVGLSYAAEQDRARKGWYEGDLKCAGALIGQQCDEFPFRTTMQGGPGKSPPTSLKLVDGIQNIKQGSLLGWFYKKCGLHASNQPFLVVPAPPGSKLPTMRLCNKG